MAEGLLRHLAGDRFEVMSAGTEATHARGRWPSERWARSGWTSPPRSPRRSERYLREPFDYVITVCDDANEACPFFPGAARGCTGLRGSPRSRARRRTVSSLLSGKDRIRDRVQAGLVDGGG